MKLTDLKVFQKTQIQIFCSAVIMVGVGFIIYSPAFDAGFWTDDYSFAHIAARLPFQSNLTYYFDWRNQITWYRPLQGMQWWVEYQIFGSNPFGYHVVNIAIHIAVGLLLFRLVSRMTRKWWLGFVAGTAFLTLPAIGVDAHWPAVADPLMTLFYLTTLNFWQGFLKYSNPRHYFLALVFFIATLLTKEMGASLVAVMFLMDRLLVSAPTTLKLLLVRYLPFGVIMLAYAFVEYQIQTRGVYVNLVAYRPGGHSLGNLAQYLQWLAFPWDLEVTFNQIAIFFVAVALGYFVFIQRSRGITFLIVGTLVAVIPVLPFPFALTRYMYLPALGSAVLLALGFELVRTRLNHSRWRVLIAPTLLTLFFIWQGSLVWTDAFNFANFARATRLQFRPIFQKHPTFEPDTLLYFIDPPFPTPNISGMMYLRYGANVSVYGTERGQRAGLRDHKYAFVYYLDDQGVWKENAVSKNVNVRIVPELPVRMAETFSMIGVDLVSGTIRQGEAVVLVIAWDYKKTFDKDYTVFAHMVDANGKTVAASDDLLRQWGAPTSTWKIKSDEITSHALVIPIDDAIPRGEYKLYVGLYYLPTQERLAILDANGNPVTDKIVIQPITIVE